ncbi:MAG: Ig-like domain-containing protein [Pseudonocardiaceae bacterium]
MIPPLGAGTPTGIVTFTIAGGPTLSGTLDAGGQASVTTSALATGSHIVTASYGGDGDFAGSSSPPLTQVVDQASTTTTLTATPDPPALGRTVPAAGGLTQATPAHSAPGIQTATMAGTAATATTLTATPNPSVFGQSVTFTATVVAVETATATTLTATPNPSVFGQSVTLTAAVATSGTGTPTGTVTFTITGGPTLSGTLNASGQASVTTSALHAGSHTVVATYGGDATFTGSSSAPLTQVVDKAPTTTTFTSTPNPSTSGQFVIFIALVTAPPGTGAPTGTVTFSAGPSLTRTLDVSGHALLAINSLSVGPHTVSVTYHGDPDFLASASTTRIQTVH